MLISTFGFLLLTPFILLILFSLATLAVVTSTITSSFIFLRLTLLSIEMISGLTLESTNWLLSTCLNRIKLLLVWITTLKQKKELKATTDESENCKPLLTRRKLPSSSLFLSRLPYKATLKRNYSKSAPGTPDSESYHHYQLVI